MIPVIAGVPRQLAVEIFDDMEACVSPGVVTAHQLDACGGDRLTFELTWDTFRRNRILECEIPKYDGHLGRPNAFVPISLPEVPSREPHG